MKAIPLFILLGMLTSCEGFHLQGHVKAEKTSHQSMHSTIPPNASVHTPVKFGGHHHDFPHGNISGNTKGIKFDLTE